MTRRATPKCTKARNQAERPPPDGEVGSREDLDDYLRILADKGCLKERFDAKTNQATYGATPELVHDELEQVNKVHGGRLALWQQLYTMLNEHGSSPEEALIKSLKAMKELSFARIIEDIIDAVQSGDLNGLTIMDPSGLRALFQQL